MCALCVKLVSTEVRKGHTGSLELSLCVLGTQPRSSARSANALIFFIFLFYLFIFFTSKFCPLRQSEQRVIPSAANKTDSNVQRIKKQARAQGTRVYVNVRSPVTT